VEPPCVSLEFFGDGRATQYSWARQCAAPDRVGHAGAVCCSPDDAKTVVSGSGSPHCLYIAEPMSHTTAVARCAAQGAVLCKSYATFTNGAKDEGARNWQEACADHQYVCAVIMS